jgi:hypothetical protein
MQDYCNPPLRLANRSTTSPHVSTVDDNDASARQPAVTTTLVLSPISTTAGFVAGRVWGPAQITLRPGQMEKMAYAQPVPRSERAQRFAGAGLKEALVAGMLGSSEAGVRTGRSFLLAVVEAHSGPRGTWYS